MSRLLQTALILIVIITCQIACQESRDPQSADGALRLFGVALEEGDRTLIKASLSEQTNVTLESILKTLENLNKEIAKFPSTEAREWARTNALGERLAQLKELSSPDTLWLALVGPKLKWAQEQGGGTVEQGLNPRRVISGSEGEGELTVLTRSDNKVSLRREGIRWVITSFESPLKELNETLKRSLKALPPNRNEWVRRDRLDLILPHQAK